MFLVDSVILSALGLLMQMWFVLCLLLLPDIYIGL